MKNIKYIWLLAVLLGFTACESDDDSSTANEPLPALTAGSADFSNYVSLGASFTAGFTDNALFKASQENSFPNILSQKFASIGGGSFTQPLMNDNVGGLLFGGTLIQNPRLYFDGSGPVVLPATPTTEVTNILVGPFNNMGIPGAKSFHFVANGYGNPAGVPVGAANPYFARMASSTSTSVLADAAVQNPSFFTLSEIGGNDVLRYALSGGVGVDQTGNLDPTTYGSNDITDPNVFANVVNAITATLTANGAKGAIANVPYIADLAHFTTVPYNPLDPSNPDFGPQIPMLNTIFGALNQIYVAIGQPERSVVFSDTEANAVVIKDENLVDISATITGALNANPDFPAFIQQFGLPPAAAPLVANLLGTSYGQTRQATANDLFVLPSSSIIGTVNEDSSAFLQSQGLSTGLADQFSIEGVTYALQDKWALTPQEQLSIKTAVDSYNQTIANIASTYDLALVDLNSVLSNASLNGVPAGSYTLTTNLVTGGLISLDGVHLTAKGYAIMANEFLKSIDATYGSNFIEAGFKANVDNFNIAYSPLLQ